MLANTIRDHRTRCRGDLRGRTQIHGDSDFSMLIRGSELTTHQGTNTADQHSKRGSHLSGNNHTNLTKDPHQHHSSGTSKTSTSRGTNSSRTDFLARRLSDSLHSHGLLPFQLRQDSVDLGLQGD